MLDGYPNYQEQLDLLHKRQITPVKIIELKIDPREVLMRAYKDRISDIREYPQHNRCVCSVRRNDLRRTFSIAVANSLRSAKHRSVCKFFGKEFLWIVYFHGSFIQILHLRALKEFLQLGRRVRFLEALLPAN